MRDRRFTAIVRTGLVLPRPTGTGGTWRPHTDAERHLLTQAQQLDAARRWLVEEVARLRQVMRDLGISDGAGRPQVSQLHGTDLPQLELKVLAGAAAGEPTPETATRLHLSEDGVKNARRRIAKRLGARNTSHAIALAVGAGLITVPPAGGEDR
ncbi:hypothetical protein GCM10009802_03460 [Streptomyces synnematoformans]|uniref:HTH luxR-type domain-containing protein n=2 Tax=Streptomyces synnematoformans TaxID=415721 RepID=A0ABP5IYR2_9ACTN